MKTYILKTYIFNSKNIIKAKTIGDAIKYYYDNIDAITTIKWIETANENNDSQYID